MCLVKISKSHLGRHNTKRYNDLFLMKIGVSNADAFLSEDVQSSKKFMQVLSVLSVAHYEFSILKETYTKTGMWFKAKSKLKERLLDIQKQEKQIASLCQTASSITITASIGYEKLAANVVAKQIVLRRLLFAMNKLNSSLRNKKLLQDIRRRINQAGLLCDATVFKSNKVSFECMNDVSLTWEDAFTNLVKSVHAPKALTPLDVGQMIELGHLLEACSSVPVNLLMSQIGVKSELKKEFVTEVLQFFPVVHINDPENNEDTNIINIWQMDLYDESSINLAKEVPVPSENAPVANKPVFGPHNIRGRKPFVRKFPQMVEEATKFVRLHGYSAHSRRRESTAMSAGVSIEDVYNHLLTVVPGLRENGLSINTVRYMFCAPNKAAKSGQLYKGYVQARVPKKRNNIRKKHGDAHYLFSRVKYRREMASMFNDEVLVLSVDCMNQLRLGSNTMVSRYHQNNKLYPGDDFPDLEDHDFPVPGYLGKPSGLMELRFKNNFTVNTSEVNFIELYEQSASCDEELCNVDDIFRQNVVTEVIDCIISKVERNVENAKETIDENWMQKGFESSAPVKDKHGRPHFKTPHTGPAHVYIRSTKR